MKFYGITMQGKFVNHTLDTVPAFNTATDPGRLIYTLDDGKLWWGDGFSSPPRWRSISDYVDVGNSEAEDMYSDLLRTTVFLNCTWDNFDETTVNNPLIANASAMVYNDTLKIYEYDGGTSNVLQSLNLKDAVVTAVPEIRHCMPSVWWINTAGNDTPQIYVTANGGTNWESATNNDFHKFDYPGNDLRMRVVIPSGVTTGFIRSWGLLYNKDLSVSCARQALTTYEIVITSETTIYTPYTVGAVLVYMNGILLQDEEDYTATDGSSIDIHSPAPQAGDVITVISYSTLITTTGPVDHSPYMRHDGAVAYTGIAGTGTGGVGSGTYQDFGGKAITNLAAGTGPTDSVRVDQLDPDTNTDMRHYRLYNTALSEIRISADDTDVSFTRPIEMAGYKVTNIGLATVGSDAINVTYGNTNYAPLSHVGAGSLASSSNYGHARIWTDGAGTLRIQVV